MSISSRSKTIIAVAAASALLLAGGGAALAYWTSTGTGTGTATTEESVDFTIDVSPTTTGSLTPGGPGETVTFSVTNPATGSQRLSSVVVTVAEGGGLDWDDVAGCSSADYTVGTPVITYGDIAAAGTVTGTVTITMNNLSTNQDPCQGADVPLYFVAG